MFNGVHQGPFFGPDQIVIGFIVTALHIFIAFREDYFLHCWICGVLAETDLEDLIFDVILGSDLVLRPARKYQLDG
jgi:hypothetical protein